MGFYIDMIGVGQGDAFLLTLGTPQGDIKILVDGGPPDAGDTVADFIIQHAAGHVHGIIGTHLDRDHIGGLKTVVKRCSFNHLYLNLPKDVSVLYFTLMLQRMNKTKQGKLWDRIEKNLGDAVELLEALEKKGKAPKPIVAPAYWPLLGDIQFNVLNPTQPRLDEAWAEIEEEEKLEKAISRLVGEKLAEKWGLPEAPETTAENNSSVVIELIYQNVPYALLTGDAGADVLREVTQGKKYPFLKVAHHASKTGLDDALIAQLQPKIACISVGPNSYGHPAKEVLEMLREAGAAIYCSEKVDGCCRQNCPAIRRRTVCFPKDRPLRPNWVATPFCS